MNGTSDFPALSLSETHGVLSNVLDTVPPIPQLYALDGRDTVEKLGPDYHHPSCLTYHTTTTTFISAMR